jgi:hypothetical protein
MFDSAERIKKYSYGTEYTGAGISVKISHNSIAYYPCLYSLKDQELAVPYERIWFGLVEALAEEITTHRGIFI